MGSEAAVELQDLVDNLFEALEEEDEPEARSIIKNMRKKLIAIEEDLGEAPTPTSIDDKED